ncbi:XdhC family protein [Neolewinella lacunae]|uniref:XdhC family protein n=1 Tax=Neolewinella lacunae TaxID=1517758 RepID=A0A923TE49_9BACT|nr:XdhC family protein [Neolewinella lacunae]MBC6995532.1 XdhC family protein [Neolewinella lacunae]MDN3635120.1 XdhC family protein [Neolewinella lacunae]
MQEIRQIIAHYDHLKASNTACALAVVVEVEGSSYRRIGARLLVGANGQFAGGISGGCLEGDALRRASRAILASAPSIHVYDTLDGEDAVIGIGLGCNGRIAVLFIPLSYADPHNEVEILRGLVATRSPQLLVRVLRQSAALSPRVYRSEELPQLAAALGLPPEMLSETANAILRSNRSRVVALPADAETPHHLLCEVVAPEVHLILTGTNYDIPPALAAARQLGWRTTLVGARRKFTPRMQELADTLVDYAQVGSVGVDAATAVVLMSHDYEWDKKMVVHFLPLQPAYLGLLGPRKRVEKMAEEMPELDLLAYPRLYAPVGLDIGAESPAEIAASLVAEVVMVLRGRTGGALRERSGPVHERE